jgi:hypothetical protein
MSEQPVRRLSAAEITAEAERHIDDYLDGGYDLEAKDVQAAVDAGVEPQAIAAIWAHAKTLRPSGPKPADFFHLRRYLRMCQRYRHNQSLRLKLIGLLNGQSARKRW